MFSDEKLEPIQTFKIPLIFGLSTSIFSFSHNSLSFSSVPFRRHYVIITDQQNYACHSES